MGFLKFLNEFEIEGEHQGKPLWDGVSYIDDKGNIDLYNLDLTELPCIFPEKWDKSVYIHMNRLTNLIGCPKYIKGSFNAGYNNLTNLINGPIEVGDSYVVKSNELTSLEGIPNTINGELYLNDNELTEKNISELPSIINGTLNLYGNRFKDDDLKLIKDIRAVSQVKGKINV